MEKFYKLTLERLIVDYKKDRLTASGLIYYYIQIKAKDSPIGEVILVSKNVCSELPINIDQFNRAITEIIDSPDTDVSCGILPDGRKICCYGEMSERS